MNLLSLVLSVVLQGPLASDPELPRPVVVRAADAGKPSTPVVPVAEAGTTSTPSSGSPGSTLSPPAAATPIPSSQSPIPSSQSPIPNPQPPISNPQPPIPSAQSPIPNSQSPIPNPQSPIPSSQSPIPNPQSPIPNPSAGFPRQEPPPSALPNRSKLTPPEMVAELLKLPTGTAVTGRPISLAEALALARDRARQLEVVHAYWRLTLAIGEYRVWLDQCDQLGKLPSKASDSAILRAAQASSAAGLRVAEVAAVRGQHELAEAAMLAPIQLLPLPADRPHVGPYRTNFERVFVVGGAPPRARLIDRTLPVRRKAIDARADAVEAGQYALEATLDAYGRGDVDLSAVLGSLDFWSQQRRAFLAAVCDYNHDIADFALAVAGPELTVPSVVGMLIMSPSGRTAPSAPASNSSPAPGTVPNRLRPEVDKGVSAPLEGARQAIFTEPLTGPAVETSAPNSPSPVSASTSPSGDTVNGPTHSILKSPEEKPPAAPNLLPASGQTPALMPPNNQDPAPTPPLDSAIRRPTYRNGERGPVPGATAPISPASPSDSGTSAPRTVQKLELAADSATAAAFYPALFDAQPGVRAKRLALWFHANASLPDRSGEPIDLAACLRRLLSADRRGLLDAYWAASQRAAEYQAYTQQASQIQLLDPIALQRSNRPHEYPAIAAEREAVNADRYDAHVRLLEAQFELTGRTDRPLDGAWLLPATPPHAGPYNLRLETQSPAPASVWRVKRLAATIPSLYASLQQRATAVVEADKAREPDLSDYQAGRRSIEQVLWGIRRQSAQTLAYLESLTQYNRAIAEYSLTVRPHSSPMNSCGRS